MNALNVKHKPFNIQPVESRCTAGQRWPTAVRFDAAYLSHDNKKCLSKRRFLLQPDFGGMTTLLEKLIIHWAIGFFKWDNFHIKRHKRFKVLAVNGIIVLEKTLKASQESILTIVPQLNPST